MISLALLEFQSGRFAEARALFERAHAMSPSARTLRGIGIAAFEMRDYPQAWVSLREALDNTTSPLTPEMREDATLLLTRIDVFLSRIELVDLPSEANVLVDGRPAVTRDALVLVGPGAHTISIEAEGMRRRTLSLEAVSGATQRIVVDLVPLPSAEPREAVTPETAPVTTPAPIGRADEAPEAPRSRAPLVLMTGGAAVTVVGITLGSLGLARARDEDRDASNARRLGYAGDALLGVGIATCVTGLVLRLVSGGDAEPDVVVTGSVSRADVALSIRGRF